jgi:hypothetical protein
MTHISVNYTLRDALHLPHLWTRTRRYTLLVVGGQEFAWIICRGAIISGGIPEGYKYCQTMYVGTVSWIIYHWISYNVWDCKDDIKN